MGRRKRDPGFVNAPGVSRTSSHRNTRGNPSHAAGINHMMDFKKLATLKDVLPSDPFLDDDD